MFFLVFSWDISMGFHVVHIKQGTSLPGAFVRRGEYFSLDLAQELRGLGFEARWFRWRMGWADGMMGYVNFNSYYPLVNKAIENGHL